MQLAALAESTAFAKFCDAVEPVCPMNTPQPHSSFTTVMQSETSPSVQLMACDLVDATLASNVVQSSDASTGVMTSGTLLSAISESVPASVALLASLSSADRTAQSQLHAASEIAKTPKIKAERETAGRARDVSTLGVPTSDATLRAMRVQRWRAGGTVVVALTIAFSSHVARADDAELDARAAYDEGLAAHESGDEKTAARDFAKADAILPSNEALEAATASALRADDAILGMTLVERSSSRQLDARATETIERARRAFAPRVSTIVIDCNGAKECTAAIDDAAAVDAHAALLALPGKHSLTISRYENRQIVNINAGGGEVVRIPPEEMRVPLLFPQPEPPSSSSPIVRPIAYAAIGVTLVLGAFSIASGVDAKSKRTDFENGNCGTDAAASTSPSSDCNQLASSGHSAQVRTNWLFAGTAVAVVGTLAFVIIAKPFGSRSNVAVSASLGGVSGALTF